MSQPRKHGSNNEVGIVNVGVTSELLQQKNFMIPVTCLISQHTAL